MLGPDPNTLDHGESARDSIIRELREEIGYEFKLVRFLGCFEYSFDPNVIKHAKCHTHEYSLIFEVTSDELPPVSSGKTVKQVETHIEFEYIPIDHLESVDFPPVICEI